MMFSKCLIRGWVRGSLDREGDGGERARLESS